MNISETNAINAIKNEKSFIIAKDKSIKKYNQGVRFRNFLRRKRR